MEIGYSLTSVAQTIMMKSAKLARLLSDEKIAYLKLVSLVDIDVSNHDYGISKYPTKSLLVLEEPSYFWSVAR